MRFAVKAIAWTYLAIGAIAGLRFVHAVLFGGQRDLNGIVLGLLLGVGLLALNPIARVVAILLSALGLLGGAAGIVLCAGHLAGWSVASGGMITERPALAFGVLAAVVTFAGWQLWVLTRPEVAALFGRVLVSRAPGRTCTKCGRAVDSPFCPYCNSPAIDGGRQPVE